MPPNYSNIPVGFDPYTLIRVDEGRPRQEDGLASPDEVDRTLRRMVGVGLNQLISAYSAMLSGLSPYAAATPSPEVAEAAAVKKLQETVLAQQEWAARVKKQPAPYATVLQVRDDAIVVNIAGRSVEVGKPRELEVAFGATVRTSAETCAILDVVKDPPDAGEITTVTRVLDKRRAEIERAGVSRCVNYAGELAEGDRVVLDAGGAVVIANLGKPPNDYAYARPTGVTWDDVGGLADAKRVLREAIEAPVKHAHIYARRGKKPLRGVLLYGPSGCGKTMLGKAAATALAELHGASSGGAFLYCKGPEILNQYVGTSEANVRRLFATARDHRKQHGYPAVLFLDEADAILGARGDHGFGLERTIVPQFLSEMDGLDESGALVLIATNRPEQLDPAIVRDGRIDRRVKVTRPTREDAVSIFGRLLASVPLAKRAARELFADKYAVRPGVPLSAAVSGAMIAGIVDRATSRAMAREIDGGDGDVTDEDLASSVGDVCREAASIRLEDDIRLPHGHAGNPSAN